MRYSLFLLPVFLCTVSTSTLQAVTVHVPGQYSTIQAGIDACVDGDTVLVSDGTYTGDGNRDIDFTGKAIVLMSENGPEVTIIDCQGSPSAWYRGFYFHSGEDSTSVVQGFTITNGYYFNGGGFYIFQSSPTITGNIIVNNSTQEEPFGYGGGIYCYWASPTIEENTISQNMAEWGGGIYCTTFSGPSITDNTIEGNVTRSGAGAGLCTSNSDVIITGNTITANASGTLSGAGGGGFTCQLGTSIIENNTISENTATGVGAGFFLWGDISTISNNLITNNTADQLAGGIGFLNASSATMLNNTIAENNARWGGGGLWLAESSAVDITNSIFWNNSAISGNEIYIGQINPPYIPSTLTISYSDVEGGEGAVFVGKGCTLNWGDGMIDADPLFGSFNGFDFLLRRGSPCIDAGDPTIDDGFEWPEWYNNGSPSDMGAYGGPGNVNWLP